MITQPLNFLKVAQGLQEGLVYTHPTFSVDEYLTGKTSTFASAIDFNP